MPKMKLSELAVARMKAPNAGRVEVWDSVLPAFGLRVSATGRKVWIAAVRKPGSANPARQSIGTYPELSLADARTAARALMADPAGVVAEQKRAKAATVGAVVAEFIGRYQKPRNRRWRDVERLLLRELAPWSDWPIGDIAKRDVIALLDVTADRAPVMANRLLAHIRKLFSWAVERSILDASPVAGVKAPARETSRDRVLTDAELVAVWRACDGLGWPFGPLVRLLIATGARRDEVARMAWPQVDHDAALWTLPREQTKADRAHTVALSDLALDILEALPRLGDGLVFPASRQGSANPVSGFSVAKRRLDALSGVSGWRFHDIRRTVATGLQRLGVRLEVTEAVLGHVSGSRAGIVAVYQRHAYADEKAAALAAWGRHVESLIRPEPAKVVKLRTGT
jgi:integrase